MKRVKKIWSWKVRSDVEKFTWSCTWHVWGAGFGYQHLQSDPCVYIQRNTDGVCIITVWVNDLLLFTSSDRLTQQMKDDIGSQWEATDMGDPTRIIGIEITHKDDSITISQQKYVESILRWEHMENANSVVMPLDPNIKIQLNPDENEGNRSNSFAKLLGELQFLALSQCDTPWYSTRRESTYCIHSKLQHTGADWSIKADTSLSRWNQKLRDYLFKISFHCYW